MTCDTSPLSQPIRFGAIMACNRIVMAPLARTLADARAFVPALQAGHPAPRGGRLPSRLAAPAAPTLTCPAFARRSAAVPAAGGAHSGWRCGWLHGPSSPPLTPVGAPSERRAFRSEGFGAAWHRMGGRSCARRSVTQTESGSRCVRHPSSSRHRHRILPTEGTSDDPRESFLDLTCQPRSADRGTTLSPVLGQLQDTRS